MTPPNFDLSWSLTVKETGPDAVFGGLAASCAERIKL